MQVTGSEYVGPRKFYESFRYALEGIVYCINTQKNMRIHFAIAMITIMAGLAVKISRLELIIIIMAISVVFVCEIINTAVEKAIDATTHEYNPIAKIAKDVAAGAVLVAAINSIIVGLLIFGRFFWLLP
jgi:diacylglycerol kinase (ATP)